MKPLSWQIGDVKITQIVETVDGKDIQSGLPQASQENVSKISWLQPNFADFDGNLKAQTSAFILETTELRVVIDTGVGNYKVRKGFPRWHDLKTDFMEKFKSDGCDQKDINYVICTHFHFDHVGWNTTLIDGEWIPSFPNARYLFSENEFNYWKELPSKEAEDDHQGFKDSVQPISEAGLADLVADDYSLTPEISLLPTPGHTPGHVSVLISSRGQQAVITGDALHSPCQMAHPEWETIFDTNKGKASSSRKDLFDRYADTKVLIIGSHFPPPTAGYLRRDGEGFKFVSNY